MKNYHIIYFVYDHFAYITNQFIPTMLKCLTKWVVIYLSNCFSKDSIKQNVFCTVFVRSRRRNVCGSVEYFSFVGFCVYRTNVICNSPFTGNLLFVVEFANGMILWKIEWTIDKQGKILKNVQFKIYEWCLVRAP